MQTVLISSLSYLNQYGDITFYPQTGGTVPIGIQLIPYYYTADYVYTDNFNYALVDEL